MKKASAAAAFLLIAFAASYYFTFLWFELNWEFRWAPWGDLIRGTAPTPFQYRALVPWLARSVCAPPPAGLALVGIRPFLFWLECGAVLLFTIAFAWHLRAFFPARLAWPLSLSVFLVLPFNFLLDRTLALRYPSDPPSLLFFTLGLALIRRRRWALFYPLFAVATLNRETTLFLAAVYLFAAWGVEPRPRVGGRLLALLVIWGAVKAFLWGIYRCNPGDGMMQGHVVRNLAFIADPKLWPLLVSNLGYLWIPLLLFRRRISDGFARRSSLVLYPFLAAMFLVGNMVELRIYGELIPVALTGVLLLIRDHPLPRGTGRF